MGRASRSKRPEERAKLAQITLDQLNERKAKLWAGPSLKEVLPPGAEPMATRYDPTTDCYHVACTDGEVRHILRANLEAAERRVAARPLIVPATCGPTDAKLIDLERKPPSQEVQEVMKRQFLEQMTVDWEVAAGRCAEFAIADGEAPLCSCCYGRAGKHPSHKSGDPCPNAAEFAVKSTLQAPDNGYIRRGRKRLALCHDCAVDCCVNTRRLELDADPDDA